jgi:diguanylate cyclase (GGDEF)-like protein/PAS domain S-box-containing protein
MPKKKSQETVRLGLMSPLSGLVSLYGQEISRAGEIACQEVNEEGGVLGNPLELIILDDGSLPDTAVPAAEKLINDYACHAIIGNLLSNSRIAIATTVSEPKKIPYLNFSFYEGSIYNKYFFHFAALPNQQIDKMIPYMAKSFGLKMFFAGSNYEWPRGSIDAAKKALLEIGGEIVGEEYLPIGSTKIEELLSKVSKSGADVFVPYFAGNDQVNLLTLFTKMGLKKKMAVVMGHYDEAMASILPPDVRAGFYSSNTYFMGINNPVNIHFLDALKRYPGVSKLFPNGNGLVTNFGESTYVCVKAFAKAINLAGSLKTEAILEQLESVSIEAPQGTVIMDRITHHAFVNTYLARCNSNGKFQLIEKFGLNPPLIPERYKGNIGKKNEKVSYVITPHSVEAPSVFSQILDVTGTAVIATNENGIILNANQIAIELFGYNKGELDGKSVHLLVPPNFRTFHEEAIKVFLDREDTEIRMGRRGEVFGYKKDGSVFPAQATIKKFVSNSNWILVVTLIDISNTKEAEEEYQWKANHDALTKLPNRSYIKDRLIHALERTKIKGNLVLLFIDLDNFKYINDTFGHEVGDQVLIKFSNLLIENARPGDTVARFGGDEFLILCEQVDTIATITNIAERINQVTRQPILFKNEEEIFSTVSIGITIGHGTTHTVDDLLREADTAMYSAKEKGKDNFSIFSEDLQKLSKLKLQIANGLRTAIEKKEFSLVYQPIVSSQNKKIIGMETLLRWSTPSGFISPASFIPIAEANGSILSIGKWVFEKACSMYTDIFKLYGDKSPYISINVSTKQLNQSHLAKDFLDIVKRESIPTNKILLEITETSLMTDTLVNHRTLRELSEGGFRIAVDDFGTGYSSLLQLLKMPVETIKIDREFIDGLDKRADSRSIVSAIIKMAKALNKGIIAEGVENEEQLFELQVLGGNLVQGYFFYRPMEEKSLFVELEQQKTREGFYQEQVYSLIYVSRAVQEISKQGLNEILSQAQEANSHKGATGFLIYNNGYFMQFLEGKEDIVKSLFEKISTDTRHTDVNIIMTTHSDERTFSDWTMGFWDMGGTDGKHDFSQWQGRTFNFLELSKDARLCYALFEGLSNSARR